MQRIRTPEMMDQPDVSRPELSKALGFIRMVNRRLGGTRALLGHLARWSRRWPRGEPITLLDVGAGSADIPLAARGWALRRGFDLRITAIDNHPTTIELAREHIARQTAGEPAIAAGIELVECDARELIGRFSPGQFDYAHAGMFLHHLPEIEVWTVLRSMDRLARAGIVWNDLARSRLGYHVVRAITARAPEMVRHDARVSVLAGFTRREVTEYARRLDLTYCRYRPHPPWQRFTLAGEKPGAWPRPAPAVIPDAAAHMSR